MLSTANTPEELIPTAAWKDTQDEVVNAGNCGMSTTILGLLGAPYLIGLAP